MSVHCVICGQKDCILFDWRTDETRSWRRSLGLRSSIASTRLLSYGAQICADHFPESHIRRENGEEFLCFYAKPLFRTKRDKEEGICSRRSSSQSTRSHEDSGGTRSPGFADTQDTPRTKQSQIPTNASPLLDNQCLYPEKELTQLPIQETACQKSPLKEDSPLPEEASYFDPQLGVFVCPVCSKGFEKESTLTEHRLGNTPDECRQWDNSSVCCPDCDRIFINKGAVPRHRIRVKCWRLTILEDPKFIRPDGCFTCPECEKILLTLTDFKGHYYQSHAAWNRSLFEREKGGKRRKFKSHNKVGRPRKNRIIE